MSIFSGCGYKKFFYALILLLIVDGCSRSEHPKINRNFVGDVAPTEVFVDQAGQFTSLNAFRGKTILVNYWATWCPPCLTELPSIAKLQSTFADKNFAVVAISVDDESEFDYAKSQLSKLTEGQLNFYHAPDFAVVYGAGVRVFPTTIVYRSNGREEFRVLGEWDWAGEDAVVAIESALAN